MTDEKKTNIPPTVGRVVLFYAKDSGVHSHGDAPLAAQIAAVLPDGTVNLGILDANGMHTNRQKVPLVQEGESKPKRGPYCEWIPYQLGQAARTEAAEEKARREAEEKAKREAEKK